MNKLPNILPTEAPEALEKVTLKATGTESASILRKHFGASPVTF
jgi:hypothetical protein